MKPLDELTDALIHALNISPVEARQLCRVLTGPRFDDSELREP